MPRKKLKARGYPEISKWDKNAEDCHRLPYLEWWIGRRAKIITTKGTVCGILRYSDGWYYCQSPEILKEDGTWAYSNSRFLFRKTEFKEVDWPRSEYWDWLEGNYVQEE